MVKAETKNPQNFKLTCNQPSYWDLGGKPWMRLTDSEMMRAQIGGGGNYDGIGANNDLIEAAFAQSGVEGTEKAFEILLEVKGDRKKYLQMNLSL